MNAIWNKLKLQPPPCSTWRTNKNTFNVKTFQAAIDKAIKELESISFDLEATFLSRLIYRMKSKFRNDKGLKSMEKVNKALLIYLNMSLVEEYRNLKSYIYMEDIRVTLPSRQLLEYVLVRTQGFIKLMERIEIVARHAAHFLKARINLGHAWSISLVAYACISRIWFLTRQLMIKCCAWYKELYQYMHKLQYVGLPWIPKDQPLPHDLEQWLSIELRNESIRCTYSRDDTWNDKILKVLKGHEVDDVDEAITIAESSLIEPNTSDAFISQKDNLTQDISEVKSTPHTNVDDIGEVISREEFEAIFPKERKMLSVKKRKLTHSNDSVTIKKSKKENKKEMIGKDSKKKSNDSKQKKKLKAMSSSKVNFSTNVTSTAKVTSKIKKRKKKLNRKK